MVNENSIQPPFVAIDIMFHTMTACMPYSYSSANDTQEKGNKRERDACHHNFDRIIVFA